MKILRDVMFQFYSSSIKTFFSLSISAASLSMFQFYSSSIKTSGGQPNTPMTPAIVSIL